MGMKEMLEIAESLDGSVITIDAPKTIDAMRTDFAPSMNSINPCCPQTKTTVSGCPRPTPRPGTILGCNVGR